MQNIKFPKDYLDEAIREIDEAKETVLVQTMNFDSGELINRLEESLERAARRGVDVRINYDWVAKKFILGNLRLIPAVVPDRRKFEESIQAKNREMYERLAASGVKLTVTNKTSFPLSLLPLIGRSHIKMLVVDKNTAWIGGVNLYEGAFENVDFMVRTRKKVLISAISSQFYKVNKDKHKKDYEVKIDEKESLFVDVGRKRKSIIYAQAKKRIMESTKSVIYMSAFVPDGKILEELMLASMRGVEVIILTSSLKSTVFRSYPDKLSYIYFKNAIKKKPKIKFMHLSRIVHAKLILIDDKFALYGSHNYTYSGVLLGTAEIMIETAEEEIVKEFNEFIKQCEI